MGGLKKLRKDGPGRLDADEAIARYDDSTCHAASSSHRPAGDFPTGTLGQVVWISGDRSNGESVLGGRA